MFAKLNNRGHRLFAVLRMKHYSLRTKRVYLDWIKRFICHFGKRHPNASPPPRRSGEINPPPHWA
ncbi:MAG: phage integrase N-terminal SAM-like domain-containing protein [Sulfuricella sp.]